jgi:uncharacterized repeat protein (TIGR03803 family)
MKIKALIISLVLISYVCTAQTFFALHQFNATDGWGPNALLQGMDGKIYGTTGTGGTNGSGTIFSMNPDGSGFNVIHYFSSSASNNTNQDGIEPSDGGLIQGTDGKLYGITDYGATNGFGTIFSTDTNGNNFIVLHYFDTAYPNNYNGRNPTGITQGSDGWLYGICPNGGTNGVGCVFKMNTNGSSYSVLHYFVVGTNDGIYPAGKLIQGNDGAFYGVTFHGPNNNLADGTVFRINANGSSYSILHTFPATSPDCNPEGIIQGIDGRLYGTTYWGEVFSLNRDGSGYSVLYSGSRQFYQNTIFQGSDGKLYGKSGGGGGGMWIFSLNTNGTTFNVVHNLGGGTGNSAVVNSTAGLIQGRDGALYGTTTTDSNSTGPDPDGSYWGTVYKLPATPLQITQAGSNLIMVSWPTWANGYYTLQTNKNLSGNGWAVVSSGIATVTNNFVLTNTLTGNSEFYRLH